MSGLNISDRIGCAFSGNGDAVGVVAKNDCRTNAAGYGAYETKQDPVGVTQQRNLDLRNKEELRYRLLIQEGAAHSRLLGHAVNVVGRSAPGTLTLSAYARPR